MKREGIIFMNEGGRDNGIPEIKPATPAPVESGGEVVRSTGDKSASRRLEEPKVNSDRAEKIGEKEIKPGIASVKRYFDNPGEINPETRKIMEEEKIDLAREDGGVDKVSILELGKFFIDEAVQAFKGKGFSERAKALLDTTDGFIADKIKNDKDFEREFLTRLGKGDFEKGRERWATLRAIKRDVSGESTKPKRAADGEAVNVDSPLQAAPTDTMGIERIAEMTGVNPEDIKTLMSAPSGEVDPNKILNFDLAPIDKRIANGSEAVAQSAPLGTDAGTGSDGSEGRPPGGGGSGASAEGTPDAPIAAVPANDDSGDTTGEASGDNQRRRRFLMRNLRRMGILAMFIFIAYWGAVYFTAKQLEANAERSRAAKSSL